MWMGVAGGGGSPEAIRRDTAWPEIWGRGSERGSAIVAVCIPGGGPVAAGWSDIAEKAEGSGWYCGGGRIEGGAVCEFGWG